MIKRTVKFVNPFTEKEETQDLYFHLNKAELSEMQLTYEGGFMEYLQRIVDARDSAGIILALRTIIGKAYGLRTADNKFVKTAAITEEFLSSEAYAEFIYWLLTSPTETEAFIKGMLPADLLKGLPAASQPVELPAGEVQKNDEDLTQEELLSMGPEQFKELMKKYEGKNVPKNLLWAAMARF